MRVLVLTITLLAPGVALACAMPPSHYKRLDAAMADIDAALAADAKAQPAKAVEKPAPADAKAPAAEAAPEKTSDDAVIPEATPATRS